MTFGFVAFVTTSVTAQLTDPHPKAVVGPPTEDVLTVPPPTSTPLRPPGTVRVVTTCPARGTLPTDLKPGTPEFDATAIQQARLQRTIIQVQQYAAAQPATFGELRFGGPNNATVVVSFTGDLEVHAQALTATVDIPNGVVVCRAVATARSQVDLANRIVAIATGAMIGGSLTPSTGRPVVVLRADRRDVAEELLQTFGPRLQVVLGEFAYPDRTVAREDAALVPPCGVVPEPSTASKALRWSVPKPLRTHSGGDMTTAVSWTNVSRGSVTYESGDPIIGLVAKVGGRQVIARYSGAIAGIGHGATLRPGATDGVSALVSTGSCEILLGYALPPGRYSVRFVFGGLDNSANGGIKVDQYVSTPIPLTITNDPPPPFTRPVNPPSSPITLPGAGGGGPGATLAAGPVTTAAP